MRCLTRLFAAAAVGTAVLVACPSSARADRLGGPMSTVSTVPPYESVFFDIPFVEDAPAVVSIAGNGRTLLHLVIYDSAGNIAVGSGARDRKTAVMPVIRGGLFRVEVRNLGQMPGTFVLSTN